jgi:hypothetical protein
MTVRKVLTDNGSLLRVLTRSPTSNIVAPALTGRRPTAKWRDSIAPWPTNGPDARLYRSDAERYQEFVTWLHTYDHHRGHTALGGRPPDPRT